MIVDIKDIKVTNRVRKDLGDIDALAKSIEEYGLLNPVTITKDYTLIAGERRIEAVKSLGLTRIDAIVIDNISALDALNMEMQENNNRKSFTEEEAEEGNRRLQRLLHPSLIDRIKKFFSYLKQAFLSLFRHKS